MIYVAPFRHMSSLRKIYTTPFVHIYKMFWILQYSLHTDWNERTKDTAYLYTFNSKEDKLSYIWERRKYYLDNSFRMITRLRALTDKDQHLWWTKRHKSITISTNCRRMDARLSAPAQWICTEDISATQAQLLFLYMLQKLGLVKYYTFLLVSSYALQHLQDSRCSSAKQPSGPILGVGLLATLTLG